MSENTTIRGSAIEYLKWSMIATAVVTFLFILIDVFGTHSLSDVTTFWDGLTKFLKLGYGYFVSALVTSVLTLLLQSYIADNGEKIGVNDTLTPHFLIVWFVYVAFYFIYLNNSSVVVFGILFLLCSIAFVYLLLKYWVEKISIKIVEGGVKNLPM
jgi:hypothetical protein